MEHEARHLGTMAPPLDGASSSGSASDNLDDGASLDFLSGLDELFAGSGDALLLWPTEEQRLAGEANTFEPVPEARAAKQSPGARISQPKRKNSTQRQKEEMQYLRSKVEELEGRLNSLKRKRDADVASNLLHSHLADSVWEEVAKRQSTERAKAEQEQGNLRAMLKSQIKLARGIEQLLGDPKVWDQLQKENWRDTIATHKGDMEVLAEMLQSIESRYGQLDDCLSFTKGLTATSGFKDTLELKSASIDGICFEAKCARVLPFDYETVRQVSWNALRQGGLGAPDDQVSVAMASNEFVLNKLRVTAPPYALEPVTAYQAIKRFPGNACEFTVSEFSAFVSGSPAEKSSPFQMTLKSWGKMSPSSLKNGQPATIMAEYFTTVVTLLKPENEDEEAETHHEIDLLVRVLATIHKEKRAAISQAIENRLVDAALSARAST